MSDRFYSTMDNHSRIREGCGTGNCSCCSSSTQRFHEDLNAYRAPRHATMPIYNHGYQQPFDFMSGTNGGAEMMMMQVFGNIIGSIMQGGRRGGFAPFGGGMPFAFMGGQQFGYDCDDDYAYGPRGRFYQRPDMYGAYNNRSYSYGRPGDVYDYTPYRDEMYGRRSYADEYYANQYRGIPQSELGRQLAQRFQQYTEQQTPFNQNGQRWRPSYGSSIGNQYGWEQENQRFAEQMRARQTPQQQMYDYQMRQELARRRAIEEERRREAQQLGNPLARMGKLMLPF